MLLHSRADYSSLDDGAADVTAQEMAATRADALEFSKLLHRNNLVGIDTSNAIADAFGLGGLCL